MDLLHIVGGNIMVIKVMFGEIQPSNARFICFHSVHEYYFS